VAGGPSSRPNAAQAARRGTKGGVSEEARRRPAGDLATAGRSLGTPAGLERLLTEFLRWKPQPIAAVGALVRAVAPLIRLLRGEILDQVAAERKAVAVGSLT
jgi:hypothetical protein